MMVPFFLLLVFLIMRTNDAFQNKVDKLSHVKKKGRKYPYCIFCPYKDAAGDEWSPADGLTLRCGGEA